MQPKLKRVIRFGSRGDDVVQVQECLNIAVTTKPGLKVDGDFGPKTAARTRQFQLKNRLKPDGSCGENTWSKMMLAVAKQAQKHGNHNIMGPDRKPGQKMKTDPRPGQKIRPDRYPGQK
ncbi:MAG: peptidoglycan-binding domain-containing protein [Candidatus Thiodiazotropha sp.]